MTTTITDPVSLPFLGPRNVKKQLKPAAAASVCFSNFGSSTSRKPIVPRLASFKHAHGFGSSTSRKPIVPRLATAASFKQTPFSRRNLLSRVRVFPAEEEEAGDDKRNATTWHYQLFSVVKLLSYQLFSVLKLLIDWFFRFSFFFSFLSVATLWMLLSK